MGHPKCFVSVWSAVSSDASGHSFIVLKGSEQMINRGGLGDILHHLITETVTVGKERKNKKGCQRAEIP